MAPQCPEPTLLVQGSSAFSFVPEASTVLCVGFSTWVRPVERYLADVHEVELQQVPRFIGRAGGFA